MSAGASLAGSWDFRRRQPAIRGACLSPAVARCGSAVNLLPLVLLYPVLNGLAEELTIRLPQRAVLPPLWVVARLWRWFSSTLGLHVLYGMPNGAAGFLLVARAGHLFIKLMLETQGCRPAILMRVAADLPTFAVYAIAAA